MELQQFKEEFDLLVDGPESVPKLREMILQLAVQGKLVEQDPTDEPASALLARIAAEKEKLIADGRIKQGEELPPIVDDEKPFHLRSGWEWVRLGSVGDICSSRRVHKRDWKESGVPFYRAREIVQLSKNGFVRNDLFIAEALFFDLSRFAGIPEPNDVMITGVGTIGVPYIVRDSDRFYFKDASVLLYKNYSRLSSRFLYHYFTSPTWKNAIHAESRGTTVDTLTINRATSTLLPLPPLPEQKRIVAKIDHLMALCDELEQRQQKSANVQITLCASALNLLTESQNEKEVRLNFNQVRANFDLIMRKPENVESLRQSILQLAVQGRLLEQDPNDEPASALLARIATEKARLVEEGKIKKQKELPPIAEDEKPFELPKGWEWVRLGQVTTKITDGTHFTPNYVPTGIKFVSAKDIKTGHLTFDKCKFITPEAHAELWKRCNPEFMDLLVSKSGSIGTVVINEFREEFSLFESLALIKYSQAQLHPGFIKLALQNTCNSLQYHQIRGIAVKHLHLDVLRTLCLPLCGREEQNRIVAKVDQLMSLCAELESGLRKSQKGGRELLAAVVHGMTMGSGK